MPESSNGLRPAARDRKGPPTETAHASRASCRRTIGRRLASEPRIDRLAFERQNAESALMDASERFAAAETLKAFQTQRKLA